MSNGSLYEISSELLELEAQIEENGGELTEELEEAFDSLLGKQVEKIDNYAALVRTVELRGETRKAEAARMATLAKRDENLAKRLKDILKDHFVAHDMKRIDGSRFTVTRSKNGGADPVKVDEGEAAELTIPVQIGEEVIPTSVSVPTGVPIRYLKLKATATPDVDQIRAELQAGAELEFASLLPRGEHVRIK
jgi:hypothetical protein